jgi:hypothetical protein
MKREIAMGEKKEIRLPEKINKEITLFLLKTLAVSQKVGK